MGCRRALRLVHCVAAAVEPLDMNATEALREFGVWGRTDAPNAGVVA
jgi:hypothetical protein